MIPHRCHAPISVLPSSPPRLPPSLPRTLLHAQADVFSMGLVVLMMAANWRQETLFYLFSKEREGTHDGVPAIVARRALEQREGNMIPLFDRSGSVGSWEWGEGRRGVRHLCCRPLEMQARRFARWGQRRPRPCFRTHGDGWLAIARRKLEGGLKWKTTRDASRIERDQQLDPPISGLLVAARLGGSLVERRCRFSLQGE